MSNCRPPEGMSRERFQAYIDAFNRNDPAYGDFVVCGTDEEKEDLVAAMKKAGFKDYNGKKLDAFVRVEDKFFDY